MSDDWGWDHFDILIDTNSVPDYLSTPESNFPITHNLSKYQVSNDMIILLHPSMLITLFCLHAIIGRLGAQIALTMLWLHYHRTGYKHNNNVTLLCFIRCKKWHIHPVYSATLLRVHKSPHKFMLTSYMKYFAKFLALLLHNTSFFHFYFIFHTS